MRYKFIVYLIFILIFNSLFTGCNFDSQEYTNFDEGYEDSSNAVDNKEPQATQNNTDEKIIFSFETVKSGKILSISISDVNDYIVYRYGEKNSIELEYPKNKKDSWKKFIYTDYYRGGGEKNEALNLNYLSFDNGNYTYTVYDEYTSSSRSVGVKVIDNLQNKTYTIEGDFQNVIGSLMLLDEIYPKLSKKNNILDSLEGNWIGIDNNKYNGTDLTIKKIDEDKFQITISAFQLNSQGYPHIGEINAYGYVNKNQIEFFADFGELRGKIQVEDGILTIEYIGDTIEYSGLNVGFACEFTRQQ